MKKSFSSLLIVIILSLAIWFYFYVKTPEAPLNSSETLLIVGICIATVFITRGVINKIIKLRKKNEQRTK